MTQERRSREALEGELTVWKELRELVVAGRREEALETIHGAIAVLARQLLSSPLDGYPGYSKAVTKKDEEGLKE